MALRISERIWGGTFLADDSTRRPPLHLEHHVRLGITHGRLAAGIAPGAAERPGVWRLAPEHRNAVRILTEVINFGDITTEVETRNIEVYRPKGTGVGFIPQEPLDALRGLFTEYGIDWEYRSHEPGQGSTPDHIGSAVVNSPYRVTIEAAGNASAGLQAYPHQIVAAGLRAALGREVGGRG